MATIRPKDETAVTAVSAGDSFLIDGTAGVRALDAASVAMTATAAPKASPALTGVPTAPTAAPGTNTTQLATTAFVTAAAAAISPSGGWIAVPQVRPTLTSGVAVTTSDVAGATSIYATPCGGNQVAIYNGTNFVPRTFTEITLALDSNSGDTNYHQSGKNFDGFLYWDGSNVGFGTGPAWTSDSARGTGAGTTELEVYLGQIVNKNSITLRFGSASGNTVVIAARQAVYFMSFRATANGQASDTKLNRLLFSAYNQALRALNVTEATTSWAYSTAAWRATNGNAANSVKVLTGLVGQNVHIDCIGISQASSATAGIFFMCGIGLNSTTATANPTAFNYSTCTTGSGTILGAFPARCTYNDAPPLGFNTFYWLEQGAGVGTQNFFGTVTGGTGLVGKALI